MKFTEIFGKTWKNYKDNFGAIFKIFFYFAFLPSFVIFVFSTIWLYFDSNARQIVINPGMINSQTFSVPWSYYVFAVVLGLLGLIILLLEFSALTSISLKKEKFTFKEAFHEGKLFYFAYLWYFIAVMFFMLGLFFFFIIPGIIFIIYWIFGINVYYEERKGIFKSLERSTELVNKKWWKIFWYLAVFMIFSLIVSGIVWLLNLPHFLSVLHKQEISFTAYTMFSLINFVGQSFFVNLIYYPLLILFFKNIYLQLKKERKLVKESARTKIKVAKVLMIIGLVFMFATIISVVVAIFFVPGFMHNSSQEPILLKDVNGTQIGIPASQCLTPYEENWNRCCILHENYTWLCEDEGIEYDKKIDDALKNNFSENFLYDSSSGIRLETPKEYLIIRNIKEGGVDVPFIFLSHVIDKNGNATGEEMFIEIMNFENQNYTNNSWLNNVDSHAVDFKEENIHALTTSKGYNATTFDRVVLLNDEKNSVSYQKTVLFREHKVAASFVGNDNAKNFVGDFDKLIDSIRFD